MEDRLSAMLTDKLNSSVAEMSAIKAHNNYQSNGPFQKQRYQQRPKTNFQQQSYQRPPVSSCQGCGRYCLNRQSCPAQNSICRFCKVKGHFEQVCRIAKRLECVFDAIGAAKATMFSVLDLASGYWQIPMDLETRHKAAFITQSGIYEWLRLPFGFSDSPASFSMVMAQVLRGINWKFVLCYVDDILVFSENFETHLDHLQQLFNCLSKANLTLKPSKCSFAVTEVKYLGQCHLQRRCQSEPRENFSSCNIS
ncbi:unnamed protein product [Mytilus coruscus]|uniref:Reverse transcriptase domain-containing protein n=1 Tax=Mytilus coruscus TaxID=42192 RepID=A0A6J8A9G9_MYTCO|nr:unnamed protein product [Mytilus coruscus]